MTSTRARAATRSWSRSSSRHAVAAQPDAIPATLADAALVRVQRLDAGTRRILAIVAVAGGRVDHGVLTRVASPADPLPALRRGPRGGAAGA